MQKILAVADVPWVRNEVHAALPAPDYEIIDLTDPTTAGTDALEASVDAVVADMQIGSMGAMAITHDVRDQARSAGVDAIPVVILLDRQADAFLAKRAGAAAWLAKPFTSHELRSALAGVLAGAAAAVDAE
jgi:DNA-binding response OmpR family regulator